MYACIATTNTSMTLIKSENKTESGATQIVFNININDIRLKIITCPAVIFANKRIINAIGFTNIPIISIGIKNSFIGTGKPGIQNMCFQ